MSTNPQKTSVGPTNPNENFGESKNVILGKRSRQHVLSQEQRSEIAEWMCQQEQKISCSDLSLNSGANKNHKIPSKAILHFSHFFHGNYKANLQKASRIYTQRHFLSGLSPSTGKKLSKNNDPPQTEDSMFFLQDTHVNNLAIESYDSVMTANARTLIKGNSSAMQLDWDETGQVCEFKPQMPFTDRFCQSEHVVPLGLIMKKLPLKYQERADEMLTKYLPKELVDAINQIHLQKSIVIQIVSDENSRHILDNGVAYLAADEDGVHIVKSTYNGKKKNFRLIRQENSPFFYVQLDSLAALHFLTLDFGQEFVRDEKSHYLSTSSKHDDNLKSIPVKLKLIPVLEFNSIKSIPSCIGFRLVLGNSPEELHADNTTRKEVTRKVNAFLPGGFLAFDNCIGKDRDDSYRLRPHVRTANFKDSTCGLFKILPLFDVISI